MKLTKFALPVIMMTALSACLGGGGTVTQSATGVSSCGNVSGVSAQYISGSNVRCGPQAELPYSFR